MRKTPCSCRSRGDEALIHQKTKALSEPPHVGSYFLNGLLNSTSVDNRNILWHDCAACAVAQKAVCPSPVARVQLMTRDAGRFLQAARPMVKKRQGHGHETSNIQRPTSNAGTRHGIYDHDSCRSAGEGGIICDYEEPTPSRLIPEMVILRGSRWNPIRRPADAL
jgi:hypothetical protein